MISGILCELGLCSENDPSIRPLIFTVAALALVYYGYKNEQTKRMIAYNSAAAQNKHSSNGSYTNTNTKRI